MQQKKITFRSEAVVRFRVERRCDRRGEGLLTHCAGRKYTKAVGDDEGVGGIRWRVDSHLNHEGSEVNHSSPGPAFFGRDAARGLP